MYVCTFVLCSNVMYVVYVCMYKFMWNCVMFVDVSNYTCLHVCMYVCMYVYVCM